MDTYPPEARKALGESLQQRRGQLGYPTRPAFLRAAGIAISPKTLQRLEKGVRVSYDPASAAAIERIYQLVPGSVRARLGGGRLTPLPGTPGSGPPLPALTDEQRELMQLVQDALLRRNAESARRA